MSTLHWEDEQAEIHKLVVGPIDNNVFVLRCKQTGEALLIDAANEHDKLLELCRRLNVGQVIETHGHWDHIQAVPQLRDAGYRVHITAEDADMLPSYDQLLEDDSAIDVGRLRLHTIQTPGHTPGSICFRLEGSPRPVLRRHALPRRAGQHRHRPRRLRHHHRVHRPEALHAPARTRWCCPVMATTPRSGPSGRTCRSGSIGDGEPMSSDALPYDQRPTDHTPVHTADLPPTPIRDRNIPATAWVEAPESLRNLGDDLPEAPVAEYKRRIGPWILWRAGPASKGARPLLGRPRRRSRPGLHPAPVPRRVGRRRRPRRRAPRPLPVVEGRPARPRLRRRRRASTPSPAASTPTRPMAATTTPRRSRPPAAAGTAAATSPVLGRGVGGGDGARIDRAPARSPASLAGSGAGAAVHSGSSGVGVEAGAGASASVLAPPSWSGPPSASAERSCSSVLVVVVGAWLLLGRLLLGRLLPASSVPASSVPASQVPASSAPGQAAAPRARAAPGRGRPRRCARSRRRDGCAGTIRWVTGTW